MNKRLLLILSILMSLSLFAMSCAKSVAAPEISVTGEGITEIDIEQELRKIGIIYANSQASSSNPNQYIDFSRLSLILGETSTDTFIIYPNTAGDIPWFDYTCDPNYVLNELQQKIASLGDMKMDFMPGNNWDGGITPNGQKKVYLSISVSSKFLTIPENLKTVRIFLQANWGTSPQP